MWHLLSLAKPIPGMIPEMWNEIYVPVIEKGIVQGGHLPVVLFHS